LFAPGRPALALNNFPRPLSLARLGVLFLNAVFHTVESIGQRLNPDRRYRLLAEGTGPF